MPRMSKKRKQEWALFLNERNRITVGGLCRKCRNDCKPPAALTEPAEQVPGATASLRFNAKSTERVPYEQCR